MHNTLHRVPGLVEHRQSARVGGATSDSPGGGFERKMRSNRDEGYRPA